MSTKLFVLYGCTEYLIVATKRHEDEKCQSVESFDFTLIRLFEYNTTISRVWYKKDIFLLFDFNNM